MPSYDLVETSPMPQRDITAAATGEHPQDERAQDTLPQKIRERLINYVKNLDPRGKDKFWWSGSLLNILSNATLRATFPAALPLKHVLTAAVNIGTIATEKVAQRYREKNWSEEQLAEHAARRQEKFPNGVSRLRRFLRGVSAGSLWSELLVNLPADAVTGHFSHPIKNTERRIKRYIPAIVGIKKDRLNMALS